MEFKIYFQLCLKNHSDALLKNNTENADHEGANCSTETHGAGSTSRTLVHILVMFLKLHFLFDEVATTTYGPSLALLPQPLCAVLKQNRGYPFTVYHTKTFISGNFNLLPFYGQTF